MWKIKEYNHYSDALEKALDDLKDMKEENLEQGWGRLLWKVIDYDYNYMAFKK